MRRVPSFQEARTRGDALDVLSSVSVGRFMNDRRAERIGLRHPDWISIGKQILTLKAGPR
jgi:hypothetical protein